MPSVLTLRNGGFIAALVLLGAAMFFVWPEAATAQHLGLMLVGSIVVFSFMDVTPARVVIVGACIWMVLALPYLAPIIVGAALIAIAMLPLVIGWQLSNLLSYAVSKIKSRQ